MRCSRVTKHGRSRSVAACFALAQFATLLAVPGPAGAASPGANGAIAFVSARSGNQDIYRVNPDGSGLTQLTAHPGADTSPAWSPDGTKIAFVSGRDGSLDVFVMGADGSNPVNVTRHPAGDTGPSWSPDGSRLAFSSSRAGGFSEVYTLRLSDLSVTQVTTSGCSQSPPADPTVCGGFLAQTNGAPTWSPDGTRLAFQKAAGTSALIYTVNSDGSNEAFLGGAGHSTQPDWSPDGSRITFSDHSNGSFVIDASGANQQLFPASTETCPGVPGCGRARLLQPAWAPDGTRVVAVAVQVINATIPRGLYTFAPEAVSATQITVDPSDEQPAWQPLVTVKRPVADFDGDGDTDISLFRPSASTWYVNGQAPVPFGAVGDLSVPCDYDGNGTSDVAVFRPSVGGWFIQGQPTVFLGVAGDIPVPGDYDGDGDCDVSVFRPAVGGWYRGGVATAYFGLEGDIPVPADYNGDGSVDLAVFRPSVGGWYRPGLATEFHGLSSDIPVPGLYDGNSSADIAVFRPSAGGWYVQGAPAAFLGLSGDIPVPGDYNGNGTAERAVFRPATGAWYVADQPAVFFGLPGDWPLPLPTAIRRVFFP